jgi:3'(2'), 5'-bisphosphate nucleotidase
VPSLAARRKSDDTPVTDADEASEALILEGLARLTPSIPIVSEEQVASGHAPFTVDAIPECFWLVDPLDGTREFVARNGQFSINIGLVVARCAVAGVLHAPVDGLSWTASGPGRARRIASDGTVQAIAARAEPADGAVVVTSRNHGDGDALAAYLSDRHVARHLLVGSARKFAMVASGDADLYPRFGPTSEWDSCAGQAILEAAGGHVRTLAGHRLIYGKPGFRNPDFTAWGR